MAEDQPVAKLQNSELMLGMIAIALAITQEVCRSDPQAKDRIIETAEQSAAALATRHKVPGATAILSLFVEAVRGVPASEPGLLEPGPSSSSH